MKIAICSDLHLEFGDINLKNEEQADVLILSGDIVIARDLHDHPEPMSTIEQSMMANGQGLGRKQQSAQRWRDFFKRCSFEFPHVVYVAGNHEFYHGNFFGSLTDLKTECGRYPNIYFLEDAVKVIDEVKFIGCTLWTDMNKGDPLTQHAISALMNDFHIIRNDRLGYTKLRPAHVIERHIRSKQFIQTVLRDCGPDDKVVVVGHHAPSSLSIADEFKNDHVGNGGYYSDMSDMMLDHPQIKLWTHGHTHYPFDYMIGDTRVVCNPRGYIGYESNASDFKLMYVEV